MNGLLSFRIAYQHIRVAFGRNVLSILAVALGVALAVAVQLMNDGIETGFINAIDDVTGRASLRVSAGEGRSFDEAVVEKVKAVAGVTAVAPLVTGVAFPDDGSGELLSVYGIDVTDDAAVRFYYDGDTGKVIDDLFEFLNSEDAVIVGKNLADQRNLAVGSAISLVTPRGRKRFVVHGLLEPRGLARTINGRLIVMDLPAAERAFTADGRINQIDVIVDRGREDDVKAAVQAVLPSGLVVEEPVLRKHVVRKAVGGIAALLGAFAALAVIAGLLICYSRMASLFEARTWEVGLLRSVGMRRSVVMLELLKESVMLGLAGAAVGIPLGIVIGEHGIPVVATFTALQSRLAVPATSVVPGGRTALLGIAVGVGAAVLAAAVPAFRMARREPVTALLHRGREVEISFRRRDLLVALALVVAAGTLVWLQLDTGWSAVGGATTALIAAACVLTARPLVVGGARLLSDATVALVGPVAGFEIGPLARHPRRAAFTVASLGLGVGAVLMFGTITQSFELTLRDQLTDMLHANLYVTSAFESDGWMSAPFNEKLLRKLGRIPGVAVVTGEQRETIDYGGSRPVLVAHDPASFTDDRVCQWRHLDRATLDAVARGDGVLISSTFAKQFAVEPGRTITLDSPTGPQELHVLGVVGAEPTVAVIMSRPRYAAAWKDDKIRWARLVLALGADAGAVQSTVEKGLGSTYRLTVRSLRELVAHFTSQVQQAFRFLDLLKTIAFVLIVIGVGDMLATSVLERTREYGMMRAVGLRRSQIFRMVVIEGGTIGIVGLALALGTGCALAAFWVHVQFPALLGWDLSWHFPYRFAVQIASLTLALCVIGALLPGWYAARLAVPEALHAD